MNQEAFIILLPTNKEAARFPKETTLHFNAKGKLTYYPSAVSHTLIQHLYICSTDEIKEEDWVINNRNEIFRASGKLFHTYEKEHLKKIIATTDRELLYYSGNDIRGRQYDAQYQLPSIPQAFIHSYIEAYNKGEQIKKCVVEYDESCGTSDYYSKAIISHAQLLGPKLNGNEIIIPIQPLPIKEQAIVSDAFTIQALKMGLLMDETRNYLMSVDTKKVTAEQIIPNTLEKLGFGRNGLESNFLN